MAADDRWYFAYGSNLDVMQKRRRTGKIREVRRCRAPGYRFTFNKRADDGSVYANIVPSLHHEVWGVMYRCSEATLARMDECEGVAAGHYKRHPVTVITDQGATVDAIAYVAGARHVTSEGTPRPDYLKRVVQGAKVHGLPPAYVRFLESLGAADRTTGPGE